MNKEEKEAIEYLKYSCTDDCLNKEFIVKPILNLIDKLQKENEDYKKLILGIKGKLNNIQFEVEQAWRKIEKLENNNE